MTISLNVKVNGDYVATVKHSIDGEAQPDTVVTGGSERSINFRHGAENTYVITEQSKADFEKDSDGEAPGDDLAESRTHNEGE